ncbi:hypothetical protein FQH03_12835 [Escherichia coli]|uniref:Uncharacterized protein n=1 Tax=Enterobacter hormaechei TaxID=158836 RepID=A0A9X7Q3C4_9ENTR|nr:hypothetical protein [Escherichia coli]PXB33204.1 hypothetical protein DL189_24835 [Enterobacter hormaechei]EFN4843204.1 hypothetical protein [Escherichia coli]MGI19857.1 hypothetical protein [Escherichia coli]MHV62136.1 hypothetical protein [Escherichia coli]
MEMVRNRAWRRHHISRLKFKRKTYRTAVAKTAKVVGKIYCTPCSCYLCGNQRTHHGLNIQELRALLRFTD